MNSNVMKIADQLRLTKHFEGGYFRETWRSRETPGIQAPGDGVRRASVSSIYYVMSRGDILTWHRLRGDNIHAWHAGGTLQLHIFDREPGGKLRTVQLGNALDDSECAFQVVVPARSWYAAEVTGDSAYTVWGEIVSPAFEYHDYEDGTKEELDRLYPNYTDIINKYIQS